MLRTRPLVPARAADDNSRPAVLHLVGDPVRRLNPPRAQDDVTRSRGEGFGEGQRAKRAPDRTRADEQRGAVGRRPCRRQRDPPARRLCAVQYDVDARRTPFRGERRAVATGAARGRRLRRSLQRERDREAGDTSSLWADDRRLDKHASAPRDNAERERVRAELPAVDDGAVGGAGNSGFEGAAARAGTGAVVTEAGGPDPGRRARPPRSARRKARHPRGRRPASSAPSQRGYGSNQSVARIHRLPGSGRARATRCWMRREPRDPAAGRRRTAALRVSGRSRRPRSTRAPSRG